MKMISPRLNLLLQGLAALTVLMSLAVMTHTWAHAFIDHTDPVVGSGP